MPETKDKEQSSASAMGVAGFRAVETAKPPARRLVNDPYARAFVPGYMYWMLKPFVDTGLYDRMSQGAGTFILLRERYIDDALAAALAAGLDQLVLLGAGFDTRAYRVPGTEKVRIFEIDQPATQAVKVKKLKKALGALPANVTFLPVDFNTQSLEERLLSNGFDEKGKTFFIWQGVTYFLTAEGVDHTLAFISRHSGPGSQVIFDYFYAEMLRDESAGYVKALRRASKLSGEAYMFGIERGQVEAFMAQRGFMGVKSLSLEEVRALYLAGKDAARPVPPGIAIASAVVG